MNRVITPTEWRAQPWKNGRGVTHEIARWPDAADDYDVRASVADVAAPGAFSQFPGYRRYSVLLDGGPIGLAAERHTDWLRSIGDAIELDGNAEITAALPAGAARLLNVLARQTAVGRNDTLLAVRFVFALAPYAGLERWQARVFDPPAPIAPGPIVWIA